MMGVVNLPLIGSKEGRGGAAVAEEVAARPAPGRHWPGAVSEANSGGQ